MGIFSNLKKTDKDEEFAASDEWLMGLADEPDDSGRFTLPTAPEAGELAPPGFAPIAEGDSESTWHFPDLESAAPSAPESSFGDDAPSWAAARIDTGSPAAFFDDLPFAQDDTDDDHDDADSPFRGDSPAPAATPKFAIDAPSPVRAAPATMGSFHDATPSGPRGPRAAALLEILGLAPLATWEDVRDAHAAAMAEYDPDREFDAERAELARAIRREMNAAYAALRLQAVA